MARFVVIREAGPGWAPGTDVLKQREVAEHSAFMNDLEGHGFLLLAGPLVDAGPEHFRALLIVEATDEAEIDQRLAGDPWASTEKLRTVSVTPWNVFVGGHRLAAAAD